MHAIRGLIIEASVHDVRVKISSGKVFTLANEHKFKIGDVAWLCIDYTTMQVKQMFTNYDFHELGEEKKQQPLHSEWLSENQYNTNEV